MAAPNLHHNLIQQISELMDSVWRYEKYYKEDASSCSDCQALWEELQKRHSEDIEHLKSHLAVHLKAKDW
ncbi:MAG: hypothetical protein BMS9Abin34_064 [Patescibacteria group bacterium]|nr:MAG: hypothetical protein BMS9Abin34_064 [Patescibacteria group bacterium]